MLFPNGRWLMCPPDYYNVSYEINPWMNKSRLPNKDRARKQWQALHHTIIRLGGWVEIVTPILNQPDMVFTANAGLTRDKKTILSHFRYPERQGEEIPFGNWFKDNGFEVIDLGGLYFEGEGDALYAGDKIFIGYGFRTDRDVVDRLTQLLSLSKVISCQLVDPYYYHLDTCFAPLDGKRALYYPGAFSKETVKLLENEIELFEVPLNDARKFACNAVVLGQDVIIPAGCSDTSNLLRKLGFSPFEVELDEYIKAGGAAKCLTLRI